MDMQLLACGRYAWGAYEPPAPASRLPHPGAQQDLGHSGSQGGVSLSVLGASTPPQLCCLQQQSTNIVPFVSFLPWDIFLITKVELGFCIQTDVCLLRAPWGGELGLPASPLLWLSSPLPLLSLAGGGGTQPHCWDP